VSGFSLVPEACRKGHCEVRGRVEERHLNINRVVHGGVYATILDTAMGAAVVSTLVGEEVTATTSLYVEFVRSARLGQTLIAEGTVTRRGHHIAFADGQVVDEQGVLLGRARGTWYIWSHGRGPSYRPSVPEPTVPSPARRGSRPSEGTSV